MFSPLASDRVARGLEVVGVALAVAAALRAAAEARDRGHRELAVQEFQAEADWAALADRQPTAG